MFGILPSGRLPQVNFERVSENQLLFQVQDVESINHLCVFMTGQTPFPDGYAGAVYFSYQSDGESKWIYLGKISNEKPSAIYRISNFKNDQLHVTQAVSLFGFQQPEHHAAAMIGISVEPVSQINQLTPAIEAASSSANLSALGNSNFPQKMLENFYNYASSFARQAPDGQQYVPFSTLQTWYDTFKRRLEINANFWK